VNCLKKNGTEYVLFLEVYAKKYKKLKRVGSKTKQNRKIKKKV